MVDQLTKVYARCALWILIALLWISSEFGLLFYISGETKPECLLACSWFNWTGSARFMLSGHTVQIFRVSSIGLRAYCILSG